MHALEKNGLLKTQNEEFLCLRAAPERIWAKMSEAGWSENGNRKLNEKMGICWHLQHTGHDGHCAGMREVHPWRANICAGAEGWFPSGWAASARAGAMFPGGIQPLEQMQSHFLAAKARHTAHTGNRCKDHFESWEGKTQDFVHTISFLCQESCCVPLCSVFCVV